jgi:predicted dehydrogenase
MGASRGLQLARACAGIPGIDTTAFYDVDPRAAAHATREVGGVAAPTLDALLQSDIDAVVVASPIPEHLAQVSAAAGAGKHILCEVTPCATLAEARELVSAIRRTGVTFMLAENYCYFSEVETVKRLHREGRFGDVYYADCDHLIDVKALWRDAAGDLTWRGRGGVGVYSTHGLGPLLTILDDRVVSVTGETVPGGQFDPDVTFPTMHLLHMTTAGGVKLRLRIDLASSRPPLGAYYAVQGTRGAYESWRGLGDESKVWLEDEHGPSSIRAWGAWHPLDRFREHYLGGAWEPVPGITGCDRRMMTGFAAVLRGEAGNPFDVYRGLDFHLPGLLGDESAARGGLPLPVPDPREWT